MYERAGLPLRELAKRAKYKSQSAISDMIQNGVGSERLKEKLTEVLKMELGFSENEHARLIDAPPGTMEEWRLRAIRAEEENERLKTAMRDLLGPSSRRLDDAAERASAGAAAALKDSLSSVRSQKAHVPNADKPEPGRGAEQESG